MDKMDKNPPKVLAGLPEDEGEAALLHERTLSGVREQFRRVWPTDYHVRKLSGPVEAESEAKRTVCALLKNKQMPGDERYERIENEFIRV